MADLDEMVLTLAASGVVTCEVVLYLRPFDRLRAGKRTVKARPDVIPLTAVRRFSDRGDHGDAIRDDGITRNADRAVPLSIE